MDTERRAAIDIGTVTTRLLVADVDDVGVREVVRRSVITHLGEGWTETGVLSEDGIARVEQAVASFAREIGTLGVARVGAVATSAARDAANGAEFLDRLESAGIRPDIISGEREAYLTFTGATHGGCGENTLVVDIGGGSTELILGAECESADSRAVEIRAARSFDVGARRVTELFLRSDPPTAREMDLAAGWVADELRPFFAGLKTRPDDMVAVAGTATSLAAIDLALDPYDPDRVHGYRIGGHALLDVLEQLSELTLEQRRHVTGLEPGRATVILGGAIILQAVLAYAGLSSTLVSEHDILYGMVLDPDESGVAGR
ncbi:MAG: Ppx/GppA phosphatase family protein [Actinomycetota bacterium]|nr:Ppx/GppA phosphatase family protein [Actinomycetota bacterium]